MSPSIVDSIPVFRRGPVEGVGNVVRFNWPLYAAGFTGVAVAFAAAILIPRPWWLSDLFRFAGFAAAYLLIASLVVSHWIYDRSPLCRFEWARRAVAAAPARILNLHSGFDETSLALRRVFPEARLEVMDFYDPATMTEASIVRARRHQATHSAPRLAATTRAVSVDALPIEPGSIDTAFAILAAHEIRRPADRQRFFSQIRAGLRPGGRLILVEHLRDPANFLAFGPQFTHFYSSRTWLALARDAGFDLVEQSRVTPFIGVFVFQNN